MPYGQSEGADQSSSVTRGGRGCLEPEPPRSTPGPTSDDNQGRGGFGKDLSQATFRNALLWLFVFGLLIRIGFLVEHARSPSFGVPTLDEKYYDMVARMLLNGEDLHELHGFRPLLYPMFLAAMYKIG